MKKESRSKLVSFLVGGLVFLVFIFPLYWMVVTALKTQVEIFSIPTPLWPENLTFDAFAKQLSSSGDTLRGFKNSLIISCGATVIATVLAIPVPVRGQEGTGAVLPHYTDASIHPGADLPLHHVL